MTDAIYEKIREYAKNNFDMFHEAIPGTSHSPEWISAGILKAVELEPEFAHVCEDFWLRFLNDDLGDWEYPEEYSANLDNKENGRSYSGLYKVNGLTEDFVEIAYNQDVDQRAIFFWYEGSPWIKNSPWYNIKQHITCDRTETAKVK